MSVSLRIPGVQTKLREVAELRPEVIAAAQSEKAELVEVRNSLKTSHGLEKLVSILCVDAYIDSNAVLYSI